ncbi:hypothetical protein CL629_04685 [bacterium]|nr:hypothetical protein [bacterium]
MKKVPKDKNYIELLKERKAESRVYKSFQLIGLEIAKILGDEGHISLYIKLAKEYDSRALLTLAKDISERQGIKNRGAYFMRVFQKQKQEGKITKK